MRTAKFKIVNDNTGEWEVEFYENEQKCKSLEVDLTKSKVAKSYSGFAIINEDLKLLLRWAKQLKNNVDDFEKKHKDFSGKNFGIIEKGNEEIQDNYFSLFTAISVIYGRLFTENKSRGVTLNRKDHVKSEHKQIHDELIKIRRDYIAHSSDKMYEDSKVFVVLNPNNSSQFLIVHHFSKVYFSAGKLIDKMIENFKCLEEHMKNKLDALHIKLTEDYKNQKLLIKSRK